MRLKKKRVIAIQLSRLKQKPDLRQLVCFIIIPLILSAPAMAATEAVIAYVNEWNGPGQCSCYKSAGKVCDTFSYHDNVTSYLANKLNTWGYYYVGTPANEDVEFHEWADKDEDSNGNDNVGPHGVDSADIGLIYTHGNVDSAHTRSQFGLGEDSPDCWLDYGKNTGNDVRWGDGDINYMIVFSCHSMEYEVFKNHGYSSSTMRSSNMGLLLGFHGSFFDGSTTYNRFKGYVDGTRYNGIGDDWVDEMTVRRFGADNDQCATAMVWAKDSSQVNLIYRYGGFKDYKRSDTGIMSFYYIKGCEPHGGSSKLPN